MDPLQRVQLAERSLRGFTMGLLSFVPLLGLPLAALAVWIGAKTLRASRSVWNPGRAYSIRAIVLGTLSLSLHGIFLVVPILFP